MFPDSAQLERTRSALGADLLAFTPELIISGTIALLLLSRLFVSCYRPHLIPVALFAVGSAFWIALRQWQGNCVFEPTTSTIFSGLLITDDFALFGRLILLGALTLLFGICLQTGIPDRDDSADFATLCLGGTLGMMLMVQSNHLLTMFIGIEMASLPSFALAGFLKGRRRGSEAALKYVIYGAAAAGVMLFGISLLTAQIGSGSFVVLAESLNKDDLSAVIITGGVFVLVGVGFKLAAVPFHFWCPDVFEGAAAEVGAFLSVSSKAAAVMLVTRLSVIFAEANPQAVAVTLGTIAAITATIGNLAAFGQSNLKRLLAYSTIAHAGYMLMAVATGTTVGISAVLFYLIAYLLMNLGAFAVVALVRNRTGSEDLSAAAGLVRRAPVLVVTLTVFLMSLLGLPPLAGFAAKFQLFLGLYETAGSSGLGWFFYTLLGVGVFNTVLSAFYYLRVIRVMALDDPPEVETTDEMYLRVEPVTANVMMIGLALGVLAVGLAWSVLSESAEQAAISLMGA